MPCLQHFCDQVWIRVNASLVINRTFKLQCNCIPYLCVYVYVTVQLQWLNWSIILLIYNFNPVICILFFIKPPCHRWGKIKNSNTQTCMYMYIYFSVLLINKLNNKFRTLYLAINLFCSCVIGQNIPTI